MFLTVLSLAMISNTVFLISLYIILFRFKALVVGVNHPLIAPPHLQSLPYCMTIARLLCNVRPPSAPPCVCHTPYNIADGNIVERPNP